MLPCYEGNVHYPPESLYIHIPFCARKCYYCDFNSVVSGAETIDHYINALEKEIKELQDTHIFRTIYIGGGTPSVLSETHLHKLLKAVVTYISTSEIQEYTIEVNPGTLTLNKIELLREYMVNRISMGVQSFQKRQLEFLGRIHSGEEAYNTVTSLKAAGFTNINIDLMFGCPGQSLDDWQKDLETVVKLNAEHVSTYALTYEEGTLLTHYLKRGRICKLDEHIEAEMYKNAIYYLSQNNYRHYEISNFAQAGYECLHNRVYWENGEYVGIGAGAYSFVGGVRSSNEKDIYEYINKVEKGENIKVFIEKLHPDQFASETLVMSLRLREGISNKNFYNRFGYYLEDRFGGQIERLVNDKLISFDDDTLKLTQKGLLIADTVMMEFV